jgi:hypothetical protein
MWAFIIGLTGVGLANSIVALVEVLSSVKYVCVDTDDDMVTAAQVLDWARAVSGFLLCVIVGYGYSRKGVLVKGAKDIYYTNVSAVMLALMATLFIGVIQQSEACHNCISDAQETFTEDTRRMLGGARCALNFRMVDFKIPENYCRDQLQLACGLLTLPTNIYAERCLIYSCSSLPHGFSFRYIYGIFGMTCQLCVCLMILMHDSLFEDAHGHTHTAIDDLRVSTNKWAADHTAAHERTLVPVPAATTSPPKATEATQPGAGRTRGLTFGEQDSLRRRRNSVPHAYSSVNQIAF